MYPTNNFNSATYSNISVNSGSSTSIFDTSSIPTGGYAMILSIVVANKSTTTRNINVTLQKSGSTTTAYMLYDVAIPSQTAFEVIQGNKFVLGKGDTLKAWGDSSGTNLIDMVVSYVIYSPAT